MARRKDARGDATGIPLFGLPSKECIAPPRLPWFSLPELQPMNDVIEAVERVTSAAHQAMLNFVEAEIEMAWGFCRAATRWTGRKRQRAIADAQKALSSVEAGARRLHLTAEEKEHLRASSTRIRAVLKTLSAKRTN
jgi:hypothetical protein